MREIRIDEWERKSHYEWFSSFADPSVAMDVKMDVTKAMAFCKSRHYSFYAVMMYIISRCVNDSAPFRLRRLNGTVVEVERANAAYTFLKDDKHFVNCRIQTDGTLEKFVSDYEENRRLHTSEKTAPKQFNNVVIVDDIYYSCIPWVSFLSVRQPIPDKSDENKSIPRICWGKCYTEGERTVTVLNITADHALVDGYDLSMLFIDIQKALDSIGTTPEEETEQEKTV